jgi:GNAT superfamily N-acetyltransferase
MPASTFFPAGSAGCFSGPDRATAACSAPMAACPVLQFSSRGLVDSSAVTTLSTIHVRNARFTDRDQLLALVPRLRAFGPGPLRPVADLDRAERDALAAALDSAATDAAIFVAVDARSADQVAGVAYVLSTTDYFTHESHAHLSILAVAEQAEGQGAGRALLDAVERWAGARGYRMITLNVFAENERARRVYERAGYTPDTVRYAKEIVPP